MPTNRREMLAQMSAATSIGVLAGCLGGDSGSEGSSGEGAEETDEETDSGESADISDDEIGIGVHVPLSGDYAWVGAAVLPVAQMLAKQINDQGGINGRQIRLVRGDTEASPDASLSSVQRLIDVEGVITVVGPTSLTYSAVFDEFVNSEIPSVSPTSGTTSLDNRGGEFVYRTVPSDVLGGRAIATAALDSAFNTVQDYQQMYLMAGEREVFQSSVDPIESAFQDRGGEIVGREDFRVGKASFQPEVESMTAANPEITALVASPEDSIKIMEAAFQAGYGGNWFVTQDQTNDDFLAKSDSRVTDGMLGLQEAVFQQAQETGRLDAFKADMSESAGWEENRLFATNTYDAMNVTCLAIKQVLAAGDELTGAAVAGNIRPVANTPGEVVTDYFQGAESIDAGDVIEYKGLVGPIEFDEYGNIVAPFSIKQADGDSWNEVSRVEAEDIR